MDRYSIALGKEPSPEDVKSTEEEKLRLWKKSLPLDYPITPDLWAAAMGANIEYLKSLRLK